MKQYVEFKLIFSDTEKQDYLIKNKINVYFSCFNKEFSYYCISFFLTKHISNNITKYDRFLFFHLDCILQYFYKYHYVIWVFKKSSRIIKMLYACTFMFSNCLFRTYVSMKSIGCILLSSFEIKAILYISSTKALLFWLLNLCCAFNFSLLFFINSSWSSPRLPTPVWFVLNVFSIWVASKQF